MAKKKVKRPANTEWDPVWKAGYRTNLLSIETWIRMADSLRDAARLLEPRVTEIWESLRHWNETKDLTNLKSDELLLVHLMLMAFAVENLLKAELVRKFYDMLREQFDSSGELPPLLKSHRLVTLATTAGLSIDPEEEDLLRRLTRAAIWAGRYPLPIEFGELSGGERFSDGNVRSISYIGGKDVDRLEKLFTRIRARLNG
jgi:hypothetical protein